MQKHFLRKNLAILVSLLLMVALVASASATTPAGDVPALPEEKPTLRVCTFNAVLSIEPDELTGIFTEKTGYPIEHIMLPADNGQDKLMLDLASGENYDVVNVHYAWFLIADGSGAFQELNALIDTYGPNIKAGLQEETWGMLSSNGSYTAIPARQPMDYISECIAIRQDVLDELEMVMPTTLDEFYEVLKTVKEKTDMIPLITDPVRFVDTIGSAFGLSTDYKVIDGKAVPRLMQDGYLDYLKFMNKLYAEGLLDSEMPITKADTKLEKWSSGKAFATTYNWGSAGTYQPALTGNIETAVVSIVRPLKGASGQQEITRTGRGIESCFAVPKASKNAASVVDFANSVLEPANFRYLSIGEEGVHHEVRDGEYYPIQPAFNDFNNTNLLRPGVIEADWEKYWQCRLRKNTDMANVFYTIYEDMNIANQSPTVGLALEKLSKYLSSTNTLQNDSVTAIISASAGDVEASFDRLVSEFLAAGGQEIIDELNAKAAN